MHSLQKARQVCISTDISNRSASAEIVTQDRNYREQDWLCTVFHVAHLEIRGETETAAINPLAQCKTKQQN